MDELPKTRDTHTHKKGNCTVIFFFLLWGGRCCVLLEKCWQLQMLNVFFPRFVTVFRPLFLQPFLFAFFIISRLLRASIYKRHDTQKVVVQVEPFTCRTRLPALLVCRTWAGLDTGRTTADGRKEKEKNFWHSFIRVTGERSRFFLLLLTNRLAFVGLGL
jgi:hypothetical protein